MASITEMNAEIDRLRDLIIRIKAALDTDEDGDNLVSVARDACRAERELAAKTIKATLVEC